MEVVAFIGLLAEEWLEMLVLHRLLGTLVFRTLIGILQFSLRLRALYLYNSPLSRSITE